MISTRYFPGITFALTVVASIGLFCLVYQLERGELRHRFLHQTWMMATSIQPDLLNDFRGQASDGELATYRTIKEHLQRFTPHYGDLHSTYLLGLRPDGEVVFLADNKPAGSSDEATPGMIYEEIDSRFRQSLNMGGPFITPAYTDRWGRWISVVIPLRAYQQTGMQFFFVADIPSHKWSGIILQSLYWLTGITLLLAAVLAGRWLLKQRLQPDSPHRERVDLAVFFITTCLLAIVIAWIFHRMEIHKEHTLFRTIAELKTRQMREAIRNVEGQFLLPVAREIAVSGGDLRTAFEEAMPSWPLPPTLNAIGGVARVPHAEKDSFLRTMRQVDPEFDLWELDSNKIKRPVTRREVYFPVVAGHPREATQSAIGFDEGSEPHRRKALQQAMATGDLAFSAPVSLIYKTNGDVNLTCFYPVRHPETNKWIGLLIGGVETRQLLLLSKILPRVQAVGDICEGTLFFEMGGKVIPLASSAEGLVADFPTSLDSSAISTTTPLYLGGQTFFLQFYPGAPFQEFKRPWMGWIIGLGGVCTSLIATLGLGILLRHRKTLEQEVDKRTRQLRESEQRFEEAAEQNRSYTWEIDADGVFTYVSRTVVSILGYTPEELVGKMRFYDLHPEAGREVFKQRAFEVFVRKERFNDVDNEAETKNGQRIWLNSSGVPLLDEAGNLAGYEGTDSAITNRRKTEDRMRILGCIAESESTMVLVTDANRRTEWANETFYRATGYRPEEIVGKKPGEILQGPDPDLELKKRMTAAFDAGKSFQCEIRNFAKDGSLYWIHMDVQPVRDPNGLLTHFVAVQRNITERKQFQEENERLRTAIEQADEVVLITDEKGTIEYVNPTFERTTGYSREEAVGQNPRFLKSGHHSEAFYRDMWNTILAGETWEGRIVNKARDGSLYTEQVTISPIRDGSGKITNFIAVKRNISRELDLEAQFLQLQKMETVGQLAGGIAHDFNNVLQAIMGNASLAARTLNDHPAEEYIQELMKAGQQAVGVTRQLLAFSRRNPIQLVSVSLNQVVEDMLKIIDRLLGDHIELRLQLGESLPEVEADRGQLEQVLLNFCINSRDAMPMGGTIEIKTGTRKSTAELREKFELPDGDLVFLSVIDTGTGIPESELPKIFEPFYTTKKEGQGTGLGLASAYGIILQHRGAIDVQSEVGTGTTMTVYLPAFVPVRDKVEKTESVLGNIRGSGQTILLAEDYDLIRNLARKILEQAGYRVLTAADGEEACRILEKEGEHIDLVISDLVMPRGGGREVRERMRKPLPQLPFLFISGYDPVALEAQSDGEVEILPKPFQPEQLLQAVGRILKESGRPLEYRL